MDNPDKKLILIDSNVRRAADDIVRYTHKIAEDKNLPLDDVIKAVVCQFLSPQDSPGNGSATCQVNDDCQTKLAELSSSTIHLNCTTESGETPPDTNITKADNSSSKEFKDCTSYNETINSHNARSVRSENLEENETATKSVVLNDVKTNSDNKNVVNEQKSSVNSDKVIVNPDTKDSTGDEITVSEIKEILDSCKTPEKPNQDNTASVKLSQRKEGETQENEHKSESDLPIGHATVIQSNSNISKTATDAPATAVTMVTNMDVGDDNDYVDDDDIICLDDEEDSNDAVEKARDGAKETDKVQPQPPRNNSIPGAIVTVCAMEVDNGYSINENQDYFDMDCEEIQETNFDLPFSRQENESVKQNENDGRREDADCTIISDDDDVSARVEVKVVKVPKACKKHTMRMTESETKQSECKTKESDNKNGNKQSKKQASKPDVGESREGVTYIVCSKDDGKIQEDLEINIEEESDDNDIEIIDLDYDTEQDTNNLEECKAEENTYHNHRNKTLYKSGPKQPEVRISKRKQDLSNILMTEGDDENITLTWKRAKAKKSSLVVSLKGKIHTNDTAGVSSNENSMDSNLDEDDESERAFMLGLVPRNNMAATSLRRTGTAVGHLGHGEGSASPMLPRLQNEAIYVSSSMMQGSIPSIRPMIYRNRNNPVNPDVHHSIFSDRVTLPYADGMQLVSVNNVNSYSPPKKKRLLDYDKKWNLQPKYSPEQDKYLALPGGIEGNSIDTEEIGGQQFYSPTIESSRVARPGAYVSVSQFRPRGRGPRVALENIESIYDQNESSYDQSAYAFTNGTYDSDNADDVDGDNDVECTGESNINSRGSRGAGRSRKPRGARTVFVNGARSRRRSFGARIRSRGVRSRGVRSRGVRSRGVTSRGVRARGVGSRGGRPRLSSNQSNSTTRLNSDVEHSANNRRGFGSRNGVSPQRRGGGRGFGFYKQGAQGLDRVRGRRLRIRGRGAIVPGAAMLFSQAYNRLSSSVDSPSTRGTRGVSKEMTARGGRTRGIRGRSRSRSRS